MPLLTLVYLRNKSYNGIKNRPLQIKRPVEVKESRGGIDEYYISYDLNEVISVTWLKI